MDAPTKTKDALQKGQPSEVKKGEPSTPPKMLTEDQANKLADEKHSKLDTKISRLEKSLVTANERATAVEAKEVERQRERDEAAVRDADGDPAKLTALQARKKFRDEQAEHKKVVVEWEKGKADFQLRIDKVEAAELKAEIQAIADKHKVDLTSLTDLNITDPKAIEGVAKAMADTWG